MLDFIEHEGLNYIDSDEVKHKIVLTHTSRNIRDYLVSLKKRRYGQNYKIPHYIIDRSGLIHKLVDESKQTNYLSDVNLNKESVVVSLENLGWLEKEPLKKHYLNWIGDIYKGDVFEKKWRDRYYWEPYKDEQIFSLLKVLSYLTEKMGIEFNVVEHNTLIKEINKYKGVVTRSNFSDNFTDLNPSFNFERILKKIENE
ncbi:N-acetylmuramoyl-L-alanine amidase [bacterium]|nr:N-acetylmuramoyl-L-alanine amidase [bacterium]